MKCYGVISSTQPGDLEAIAPKCLVKVQSIESERLTRQPSYSLLFVSLFTSSTLILLLFALYPCYFYDKFYFCLVVCILSCPRNLKGRIVLPGRLPAGWLSLQTKNRLRDIVVSTSYACRLLLFLSALVCVTSFTLPVVTGLDAFLRLLVFQAFWSWRINAPLLSAAGSHVVWSVAEVVCAHGFRWRIRRAVHELQEGWLWGGLDQGGRRQVHSSLPGQTQDLEGKMCAEELRLNYLSKQILQVGLARKDITKAPT